MIGAAHAQAVNVWDGSTGNWTTSSSWTNGAPQSSDDPTLVQSGSVTVNSAVTGGRLQVLGGGSVDIEAGGTLDTSGSAFLSTIGIAPSLVTSDPATTTATDGTGSMTINGAGAVWNTGSDGVRVGNEATGTLTVSNGGTIIMTGGLLSVGLNAGGNGTLDIDGGTITDPTAALRLGYDGATGTLNITDGGTLTTTNLNSVGLSDNGAASTGTVAISGTGSTWTVTPGTPGSDGNFNVGSGAGATGAVTVSAGGALQTNVGTAIVGFNGGAGSVTVTGSGSSWTIGNNAGLALGYGAGSSGTLVISNGATLNTGQNTFIGYNNGTSGGGTGQITVDGAGTTWNATGGGIGIGGDVVADAPGAVGTLTVSNGAVVNAASENVFIATSVGTTGTLKVLSGGTMNVEALAIGGGAGTGTTTVDGAGSKLNVAENIVVGFSPDAGGTGNGTLAITNGGVASSGADVLIGQSGTGQVTVDGQGSSLTAPTNIRVGFNGGIAVLNLTNGGAVTTPTLSVGSGTQTGAGTGTLNIGTGGVAGTVNGAITMGGLSSTINFDQNQSNFVFSSAISDDPNGAPTTGSVNFTGTGDTTLTADSTYTSPTNVSAGTLTIAAGGSIADSSMTTIASGATLAGAGAVGNVMVAGGATVAPTGTGTLTTGAITFASGSTYQVSITPSQSSNIAATTATLQGGTVQLHAGSGNFASGRTYNIVTTSGGVTGQFAGLSDPDMTFLNASLGYTTDDVTLSLSRNNVSFASIAETPNERAVATSLDNAGSGNPLVNAVESQNSNGARAAFNALSGEIYASSRAALIENAELIGDAIGRRLSQPFDGSQSAFGSLTAVNFAPDGTIANQPLAYVDDAADNNPASGAIVRKPGLTAPLAPALFYSSWVQGFGDWADFNGNGNAAAMQATTGGVLAGVDATYLGTYRIGFAGGYSGTGISDGRSSSESVDSYHIALYSGAQEGPVGVQLGGAYNWHDINATRNVAFPGFADTVKSNYNGDTAQVFGEANYRWHIGNSIIEPFAGFDYINLNTSSFGESGGPAALSVGSADQGVFFSTVGSRLSSEIAEIDGVQVIGRGTVAWRHAAFGTTPAVSAAFPTGPAFDVSGTPIARDAAVTEVGFDANIMRNMSLGLSWSGQFADNAHENSLHGQFLYRW